MRNAFLLSSIFSQKNIQIKTVLFILILIFWVDICGDKLIDILNINIHLSVEKMMCYSSADPKSEQGGGGKEGENEKI